MKQPKDFSPPRIYWSTVTIVCTIVLLVVSVIGGAAYGIVLAVRGLHGNW